MPAGRSKSPIPIPFPPGHEGGKSTWAFNILVYGLSSLGVALLVPALVIVASDDAGPQKATERSERATDDDDILDVGVNGRLHINLGPGIGLDLSSGRVGPTFEF